MYICNHPICDPICDFCWFCIYDDFGTPISCEKCNANFDGAAGYCDEFRCRLHENKQDSKNNRR